MTPPQPSYVYLAPELTFARTIEVNDDVMIDIDTEGRIIGVETLDGSDWTDALITLVMNGRLRIA